MLNLLARIRSSSASTKLAAIESVQGWVEFAPTGHIIAISDKLCETLGYTKNEVLGQHHRVLCDPELLASAEYGAFWERLRAGTADAGCYPRLRKDGTEVWLQASYTPVRRLGRVVRIIKFATDVTADRRRSSASTSHLAAMNHSQAIIQFALDGTVHEANANFLSAMGYRAEEIVGRHHRIFCDPDYANSSAYGEFWQRLGAGETFSGRYPRRRKDGSTIWIQGAYNPLRDARGRVIGVVKACIDVTEQVESERALETLVREAGDVLSAMAQGDLTGRVNGQYRGELAHIASSLNQAADSLTRTLLEVGVVARSLDISVGQLAEGTVNLSARTSAQVSSLEETAAAMEEMTASVRRNAEHAKAAETVGQQTRHAAQESGQLMAEATLAMTAISESAKRIGAITRVIDELAFQTNLLSLNAAIEAARAGEHGQGFAVVADEVRRLALRSATASREISTLVEDTMQRVADGGRLVNDTASALHGIVTSVEHVTTFVEQICVAAQEQSAGIAQVNGSVSSMDIANQQNAALAEELSAASLSLQQQANALRDQVTAFVLEKEQPADDTRRHETAAPPTGRAPSASRRSARREVFAAT